MTSDGSPGRATPERRPAMQPEVRRAAVLVTLVALLWTAGAVTLWILPTVYDLAQDNPDADGPVLFAALIFLAVSAPAATCAALLWLTAAVAFHCGARWTPTAVRVALLGSTVVSVIGAGCSS